MKQTYSEEEFKTVLKTLFAEKALVHEHQKKLQIQEKEIVQFQEKIRHLEKEIALLVEEKRRVERLLTLLQNREVIEEKKEPSPLENEKQDLIVKLAEVLTKLQKQYEINKNLRHEIAILQRET